MGNSQEREHPEGERMIRRIQASVALAVALLAVAGCSSGSHYGAGGAVTTSATTTTATQTGQASSLRASSPQASSGQASSQPAHSRSTPRPPVYVPTIPNGKGIITSVHLASCSTEPGQVAATGTVRLPAGESGAPVISVSWVNPDTSEVYARALTTVTAAKPNVSTKWSITAKLPTGLKAVSCVLGAVIPD